VDVGVVLQEAFLGGVVEVGAMVDGGDFTGRTAKDLGLPGITSVTMSELGRPTAEGKRREERPTDGCRNV